jgi:CheY-like chemotaxis protein
MPLRGHDNGILTGPDLRDGLEHLQNLGHLAVHPLARFLATDGRSLSGEGVRRELLAAIDQLRPLDGSDGLSTDWRRYRYLILRYLEGHSHDQIAHELGVSARQASRDHQAALAALLSLLTTRQDQRPGNQPGAAPLGQRANPDRFAATGAADLLAEDSSDLSEVLAGVLDTLGGLAGFQETSIQTAVADSLPAVAVDKSLLRQAVLNLLAGIVALTTRGAVLVRASDTARGVCLQLESHRPAESAPPTQAERHRSQELLEAGRAILESVGGVLEIDDPFPDLTSVAPSVLRVSFPVVALRKVLVVDDNPDIVLLFRRYLLNAPYRVIPATTGSAALHLATILRPDAIVLDVMLPSHSGDVQDGWDLLRQLRGAPALASTPVIVCSVLPELALASSLGVSEFLAKPISRARLLAVLDRCCESRRS